MEFMQHHQILYYADIENFDKFAAAFYQRLCRLDSTQLSSRRCVIMLLTFRGQIVKKRSEFAVYYGCIFVE